MRHLDLPLVALALALANPSPSRAQQPVGGVLVASSAGGMGGLWRFEVAVHPGSPEAGLHAGTLEITDDAGQLTGRIDDWSSGAGPRISGRREGGWVHLDHLDEGTWPGRRARYDGQLGSGGSLRGRFQADPTSADGNPASGTFRAWRIAGPAVPPPPELLGRFGITLAVAARYPFAGSYTGTLVLTAGADGMLRGVVDDWSNGARSTFRGHFDGARLVLLRIDGPPWSGMRGRFEGAFASDGSLAGLFENDPTSPSATFTVGTWRAERLSLLP